MADVMLDCQAGWRFLSSYRGDYGTAPAAPVDGAGEGPIVAESFEQGANISEVARRNGVARGCSRCGDTSWRQRQVPTRPALCRSGSLPRAALATGRRTGSRCVFEHDAAGDVSPPGQFRGEIEIEVSGARIWVEPGVDATTLSTVLSRCERA